MLDVSKLVTSINVAFDRHALTQEGERIVNDLIRPCPMCQDTGIAPASEPSTVSRPQVLDGAGFFCPCPVGQQKWSRVASARLDQA
jgi:hypothetical protein